MRKVRRVRPPTEIPNAAMADIAFLLLIFFIATTTIAEEFGLSLILPAKSNVTNQALQVNRENVMVLSTDESGNLYLVDDQVVPLEQIHNMVKERSFLNDKLVVSIEPNPVSPYKSMVNLLDEVKLAKHTRVSLKTKGR